MGLDFNNVDPVGIDSSALDRAVPEGAAPATAGSASFADLDMINSSPLAYFGNIVEQLGRTMSTEGQSAAQAGEDPSYGMSDAIDMIDSIVGMMSLYTANDVASPSAQSSAQLNAGAKALDSKT